MGECLRHPVATGQSCLLLNMLQCKGQLPPPPKKKAVLYLVHCLAPVVVSQAFILLIQAFPTLYLSLSLFPWDFNICFKSKVPSTGWKGYFLPLGGSGYGLYCMRGRYMGWGASFIPLYSNRIYRNKEHGKQ